MSIKFVNSWSIMAWVFLFDCPQTPCFFFFFTVLSFMCPCSLSLCVSGTLHSVDLSLYFDVVYSWLNIVAVLIKCALFWKVLRTSIGLRSWSLVNGYTRWCKSYILANILMYCHTNWLIPWCTDKHIDEYLDLRSYILKNTFMYSHTYWWTSAHVHNHID